MCTMEFQVKKVNDGWVVMKGDKEVYKGTYRQVEDWLDSNENQKTP